MHLGFFWDLREHRLCIWAIFGILVSSDCASELFLGGCQVPALDKSAKVVRKKGSAHTLYKLHTVWVILWSCQVNWEPFYSGPHLLVCTLYMFGISNSFHSKRKKHWGFNSWPNHFTLKVCMKSMFTNNKKSRRAKISLILLCIPSCQTPQHRPFEGENCQCDLIISLSSS